MALQKKEGAEDTATRLHCQTYNTFCDSLRAELSGNREPAQQVTGSVSLGEVYETKENEMENQAGA